MNDSMSAAVTGLVVVSGLCVLSGVVIVVAVVINYLNAKNEIADRQKLGLCASKEAGNSCKKTLLLSDGKNYQITVTLEDGCTRVVARPVVQDGNDGVVTYGRPAQDYLFCPSGVR